MNSELIQKIERLRSKIIDLKKKNINEAQTKEWLIKPFFELLGWDFSNPDEIVPEDDDQAGKRCDYNFCINSISKFLVEAKPLNNSLDDNKMIFEKLNYCSNTGVPLLIITNGELYKIYYAELKGVGNDKLLYEFSISSEYDEDFIEKLSKDAFERDSLLIYARNISLYTNIKKAIEKLFQSSNKTLINLINNIVKDNLGHKFGDDDIVDALKQFRIEINTDFDLLQDDKISQNNLISKQKISKSDKESNIAVDEKVWSIEHQFKFGRLQEAFELYKKLINELNNKGLHFKENPTKFYIGLISNKTNFCQVHGQKSGLKIWLNLNINDISEQASLKVRDVSNIGHWGMGDIECVANSVQDFEWLIPLIKKAYDKK